MARILYQGHGSLRLITAAGTVVYVDPFMGPKGKLDPSTYQEPADLILVTHQHFDHTALDLPRRAAGCKVWQNFDSHPDPRTWLARDFGDVRVEAVQAQNRNHPLDECVGYVVTADGMVAYFSGDTSRTRQMEDDLSLRHIDYAFWPGDGIYNMDVAGAAECARLVGAAHNVPVHLKPVVPYGEAEAQRFAALAPNALLMRPGDEVELA